MRAKAAVRRIEAGNLNWLSVARRASCAGGIVFLMLIGIVGFETVSGTGDLRLETRFGMVFGGMALAILGYVFVALLDRGRPLVPILSSIAGGITLAALLFAPDGQFGRWSNDMSRIGWVALVFLALILARAIYILATARAGVAGLGAALPRLNAVVLSAKTWVAPAALIFALILPLMPFSDRRALDVCTLVLTYIMLGWGLNIVVGLAGLLDLGYVAFYAVGAYSYALLALHFDLGFWTCLPIAGALAAFAGILLGFPVLRLRGDYLAIVTLGFGEMIRVTLINWSDFTGGPNGIDQVPRATFFGLSMDRRIREGMPSFFETFGLEYDPMYRVIFLYYVILLFALIVNLVTMRLRVLPLGRAWEALREDETASRALGINARNIKLSAFAIGAMFAGFAGSFFAARQGIVTPESFVFLELALVLAIVVLGGLGSQLGIVLAAIILIGVPELLRGLMEYRMLAFGAGLVLVMLWRPAGLIAFREPSVRLHPKTEQS